MLIVNEDFEEFKKSCAELNLSYRCDKMIEERMEICLCSESTCPRLSKPGKWIQLEDGWVKCPACSEHVVYPYKFCPYCGKPMEV